MNSASTSKPVLDVFGLVLIEDPWEILFLAAFAAGAVWWFLRKRKLKANPPKPEFSDADLVKELAIQAAGAAVPMTFFMVCTLVIALPMIYLFDSIDFFWIPAIPLLFAIIFGFPAGIRGKRLIRQPNYPAALEIYKASPKVYIEEALKDDWVRKQLAFFPPKFVQQMIWLFTLGMK